MNDFTHLAIHIKNIKPFKRFCIHCGALIEIHDFIPRTIDCFCGKTYPKPVDETIKEIEE